MSMSISDKMPLLTVHCRKKCDRWAVESNNRETVLDAYD